MTIRPNMCSHYDTNTCSCQGERQRRSSAARTTTVRRVRFASAANCTVTSTRRVAPAGGRSATSSERSPRTFTERHRWPVVSRPVERTQTFARASSPAATRVVTCGQLPAHVDLRAEHVGAGRPDERGSPSQRASAIAAETAAAEGRAEPSARASPAWKPVAQPVVAISEEAERGDVRVTGRLADELAVDRRLRHLVGDADVLDAAVPDAAGRADLPADLVEMELEPFDRRRLRGAVEGIPERLLHAVEVGEARVRPGVPALERIGRLVRVRVEAERVHQRQRAAASAVPLAERAQEAHG